MAETKTAGRQSSPTAQIVVLIALPLIVIGGFSLTLFAGFLGEQATEIAKLIAQIEQNCTVYAKAAVGFGKQDGNDEEDTMRTHGRPPPGKCETYAVGLKSMATPFIQ